MQIRTKNISFPVMTSQKCMKVVFQVDPIKDIRASLYV